MELCHQKYCLRSLECLALEKNRELLDQIEEYKQALKIEKSNQEAILKENNEEITKLKAVIKTERDQKNNIIFEIDKALRDFKQFLPELSNTCQICVDGFSLKEYKKNTLKLIESCEGYLQAVAR